MGISGQMSIQKVYKTLNSNVAPVAGTRVRINQLRSTVTTTPNIDYISTLQEIQRIQAPDAAAEDQFGSSIAVSCDGNTLAIGSPFDDTTSGTNAGSVYIYTRLGYQWSFQASIKASDASANHFFGSSVALNADGNTLAVGAIGYTASGAANAGSVYIFVRSASGTWSQQARQQSSSPAVNDEFGRCVALSSDGNTMAVSVSLDDTNGGTDAGSVVVFVRTGTSWAQQAFITAGDGSTNDNLGSSIALSADGNTLAIGAHLDDVTNITTMTDGGSVYVYYRSGTTWSLQQRIQASDVSAGDRFGDIYAVALNVDGNVLAVGSKYKDTTAGTDAGAVYVFTRSGATWTQQNIINASNSTGNDNFGSVALTADGNTLIAAAQNNVGKGSVYIYKKINSSYVETSILQASNSAAGDRFGMQVAASAHGNVIIAGASLQDNQGVSNTGSVFVFMQPFSYYPRTKLLAGDGSASDQYGVGVSMSSTGKYIAIGSWCDDFSSLINPGSVYIYALSNNTWAQQSIIKAPDSATGDYFGYVVSLDAEGKTLAVAANNDSNPKGTVAGSVYVYTRSNVTWSFQQMIYASNGASSDYFGNGTQISGDGNTIVVASILDDNAKGVDAGSLYVYTRSNNIWTERSNLVPNEASANDWMPSCAISKDGATIVGGAPRDDNAKGVDAGCVYVFTKSNNSWTEQAQLFGSDSAASDYFGTAVALNSNGNMLVVTATDKDIGVANCGAAYVFQRSGSSWTQQARLQASDPKTSDSFGTWCSMNDDGDVVVIGAKLKDVASSDTGSAYVFTKNGNIWSQSARLIAADGATSDQFGVSVATNADSRFITVGAWYDDNNNQNDTGSAYVFERALAGVDDFSYSSSNISVTVSVWTTNIDVAYRLPSDSTYTTHVSYILVTPGSTYNTAITQLVAATTYEIKITPYDKYGTVGSVFSKFITA